ncbi:protein phosphatase 2C domain-containing protein, partial [Streptomyces sp. NPDC055254]
MSQRGADDWWQKLYEDPDPGTEPDPGDTLDNRFRSAAVVVTDPAPGAPGRPAAPAPGQPGPAPVPEARSGRTAPPRPPEPLLPGPRRAETPPARADDGGTAPPYSLPPPEYRPAADPVPPPEY